MTISASYTPAQFNGNSVTTAFPIAFKVFDQADLLVIVTDSLDVDDTQVITTDYTVSLNGDQNNNPGGTVTMIVAPVTGSRLTIARDLAELQETDITQGGGFYPEVIENSLDKLTMLVQQNADSVRRAITVPVTSNVTMEVAVEAGTLLGWDAAGTEIVNYAIDGTGLVPTSGLIRLNVEDQGPVTGGVTYTSKALGTAGVVSGGTVTPDPGDRAVQHYTNGGAHTLAPSANVGSILLDITNNASAGAITTSGFTFVVGGFATTNGYKYRCHISIGNAGSLLTIQALQ